MSKGPKEHLKGRMDVIRWDFVLCNRSSRLVAVESESARSFIMPKCEREAKKHTKLSKIQWLSDEDKNTAFFHSTLKARRHKSRIEAICDESGRRFEGEKVARQFVKHFQAFLGEAKPVQPLTSVGEIMKTTLSEEDVDHMIIEVYDKEIKEALFDIESNKAPGQMFFLHASLKKLGSVLGRMFAKLLRNSSLMNAFVPGRHIQDNILITQELLRGYNKTMGAKRCVMKIDIQKTYDTVSQDFLKEELRGVCPKAGWHHVIWFTQIISKHAFLMWLAMQVWKEMVLLMKLDKDYKKMEDVVRWLLGRILTEGVCSLPSDDWSSILFRAVMSDASSAVTYTSVYTDSEPWRYYGDDSAETRPLRVIVYGYDGLLIQPVALPSPNYVPGPEHPPSPDYVPDPEHPPSPIEIPYVPEPEYLEYLTPSDDEAPLEDQPLPADDSPITASPDYVVDSDPEEDPEDDQADYPVDRGDGDDEPSDDDDDDDTDDEDPEEEPFEDEEDNEEEEEHLALADPSPIPVIDPVLPAGDAEALEALEADDPTHAPGSPIIIPLSHTHLRRAWKTVRPELPMSASIEACIARHAALPSPPLLAARIRMRALLPSTSRRTDIPAADIPPRKRACLTTPAPGFKIGESFTAGAARQLRPTESDLKRCRDDRALLRARVNTLVKDRPNHRRRAMHIDRKTMYACEALAFSIDRNPVDYRTGTHEILEARDPEPQEGPAKAGSN
nr:hypothetical protein [Tanacetum cinerariifolium]